MPRTVLYTIWWLIPAVFFALALWGGLESFSKSPKKERPSEFLKQGLFVSACVLFSMALDQYALPSIAALFDSEWLPLGFFQLILLPIVLYFGALMLGPTKAIYIGGSRGKDRK
ncbi:MAG: hypothetical protein K1X83_08075 [Oligoflexia bacterium]|nr:hypothetical protein [Oligoflexia bacterium]